MKYHLNSLRIHWYSSFVSLNWTSTLTSVTGCYYFNIPSISSSQRVIKDWTFALLKASALSSSTQCQIFRNEVSVTRRYFSLISLCVASDFVHFWGSVKQLLMKCRNFWDNVFPWNFLWNLNISTLLFGIQRQNRWSKVFTVLVQ